MGTHPHLCEPPAKVTVCRWEKEQLVPTPYQRGLLQRLARAADNPTRSRDLPALLATSGPIATLACLLYWAGDMPACSACAELARDLDRYAGEIRALRVRAKELEEALAEADSLRRGLVP